MKTPNFKASVVGLMAAPFVVITVALDWTTAVHVLAVEGAALFSLAMSWGVVEFYDEYHREKHGKKAPKFKKWSIAWSVAFGVFVAIALATPMQAWLPRGEFLAVLAGALLGFISPLIWPRISHLLIGEILLPMKVVKTKTGNVLREAHVESGDEEETLMHITEKKRQ